MSTVYDRMGLTVTVCSYADRITSGMWRAETCCRHRHVDTATERPQDVLVGSFICGHRTEVVDALMIIRKITQRCAVRW